MSIYEGVVTIGLGTVASGFGWVWKKVMNHERELGEIRECVKSLPQMHEDIREVRALIIGILEKK